MEEESNTGRLLCAGVPDLLGRGGEGERGEGRGEMAVDVASSFVWQLGEWAAGRAAGSALGPPEGCAHTVTHRYDRPPAVLGKPFQKRGPTQPQSLWEDGELSAQGHFSEGTSSLHGALREGTGQGNPSYRKSPAAKGSRLWLCSCHRQRSLEKGWSSVPWSSGKPS